MEDVILTTEENLQVAVIFLKMFGLTVETKANISIDVPINIVNSSYESVGQLIISEKSVIIQAQLIIGKLEASFDKIVFHGHIEDETNTTYAKWKSNIKYTINSGEPNRYAGFVMIDCSVDSLLGNHFYLTPFIKKYVDNKKTMSISFHNEGNAMRINLFHEGNDEELIVIAPLQRFCNYYTHVFTKNNKKDGSGWDYRQCWTINRDKQLGHDRLDLAYTLYANEKFVESSSHGIPKEPHRLHVNQIGRLLRSYDPSVFKTIESVRNQLCIGQASIFDAFMNYSLPKYSDEELLAIFGVSVDSGAREEARKDITNLFFHHGRQMTVVPK